LVAALPFPLGFDLGGDLADALVKARQRDAARVVVEGVQNSNEDMDRISCGAAEDAGVQITVGSDQHDFVSDETSKSHDDCRALPAPHPRVTNKRQIGSEFFSVLFEEGPETGTA